MLPGKTPTPSDILQMARRRVWLLAIPPVLGLFVSLIVSAMLPNMYESDVLIAIVPQRVPSSYVQSTVTLKTEERLSAMETQVTSRTYLEQLINEFDLYPSERERLPMEDVVAVMRLATQVVPEAQRRGPRGPEPLHAFHVRFQYRNAQVAAQITDRLGRMFVDQNARDRSALAEATDQFLDTQLEVARKQLEETERRLKSFRERYGNELPTQLQTNMTAIQSAQMQVQALVESTARDRDRKLMLERLYNDAVAEPVAIATPAQQQASRQPGQSSDPNQVVAGSPEQQLAQLRTQLATLQLRLTPEHPDVLRMKRRIADVEKEAADQRAATAAAEAPAGPISVTPEEARRLDQLRQQRAEIESLDRTIKFKETEETKLRNTIADYQRRIEAVPGVESEWVALTRDYDTQKTAYEDLRRKSEDARVSVELERQQIGEQFRIVDPAVVPTRPVSPTRYIINAIGLAVGLFLGIGLAIALELYDTSFRTEADVVDVLALPVLAIVPYVQTARERARRARLRVLTVTASILTLAGAAVVFWYMQLWNYLV